MFKRFVGPVMLGCLLFFCTIFGVGFFVLLCILNAFYFIQDVFIAGLNAIEFDCCFFCNKKHWRLGGNNDEPYVCSHCDKNYRY